MIYHTYTCLHNYIVLLITYVYMNIPEISSISGFSRKPRPINLPPQPARLELICKVAPLSEDFSGLSTEQLLTNTAPAGFFGAKIHGF